MERRKFLIGAGALGAGASAALGTGAFTTVEAQRNVDIGVAGDANAQLAIQEVSGANAGLVSTEDDGTLSLSIPDVNQDAVTEVEDLFRIVNQGTQSVNLYFQDDSDAVTFRVTRSTQSLEGADNSVQLGIGEQVVVGLTINTLDNDVSGTLLDSVTIVADASASAPAQSGPQPQYVVDGTGDGPNTFATLSAALGSNTIEQGAVIGIEGGQTIDESGNGTIDVGTQDVTVTGFGLGTAQIDLGSKQTLRASGDGVTLRNLKITKDDSAGRTVDLAAADNTADGLTVTKRTVPEGGSPDTAGPHIQSNGARVTITNCELQGSPIGLNNASGFATVTNNSVQDVADEGIFAFSCPNLSGIELTGNQVKNHDTDGGNPQEIKVDQKGVKVNGVASSKPDDQRITLLQNNDVSSVLVTTSGGSAVRGTKVSSQLSFFSSIQDAVNTAGSEGLTLVESGSFTESVQIDTSGLTLKGLNNPTLEGEGVDVGSQPHAAIHIDDGSGPVENVTVEGFTVRNPNGKFGVFAGTGSTSGKSDGISGLVIRNNTVENVSTTSSGGAFTGGPAGISIRADYGTGKKPGIEIDSNVIKNVENVSGPQPVGITLKSFTGEAGFGKDSTGNNKTDSKSPPATDTDIVNNRISGISSGGGYATKGISVSGEFEDVVVDGNTLTGISSPGGTALGITLSENGGSYSGNQYDIDGDGNGERIGPRDFEIKNNEFRDISGSDTRSVNIGGYEDLTGSGSHTVEGNNIFDTGAAVTRFAGDQAGYQIGDGDTLNVRNNYWGAPSGPSGEDGVGGDGAPALTLGTDANGNDRTGKVDAGESASDSDGYSSSPNSGAGSSL